MGIGGYQVICSRVLLGIRHALNWETIILFLICLVAKSSCKVFRVWVVKRESNIVEIFFK